MKNLNVMYLVADATNCFPNPRASYYVYSTIRTPIEKSISVSSVASLSLHAQTRKGVFLFDDDLRSLFTIIKTSFLAHDDNVNDLSVF